MSKNARVLPHSGVCVCVFEESEPFASGFCVFFFLVRRLWHIRTLIDSRYILNGSACFQLWIHNPPFMRVKFIRKQSTAEPLYYTENGAFLSFFLLLFYLLVKTHTSTEGETNVEKYSAKNCWNWKRKPVATIDFWKWMRIWHFSSDLSPWQTS